MIELGKTHTAAERIELLEIQQDEDFLELKTQLKASVEALKPMNLLKNAGSTLIQSKSLKSTVLNNAIGLGLGFLVKRILIGKSQNPIRKMVGTGAQLILAYVVAQHGDDIVKMVSRQIDQNSWRQEEIDHCI